MRGLFAFLCFGVGAALLIAALSAFLRRRRFEKISSRCTGRVLSVEEEAARTASGGRITVYTLHVQYQVQDVDYSAVLQLTAKPRQKPGDEVELLYDSAEPQRLMTASGTGDLKNTLGLALLVLVFVALGLFFSL